MGIHIIPCIVGELQKGYLYSYYENEEFQDFDGLRHVGDKDFVNCEHIEWIALVDDPKDYTSRIYQRPKDFEFAIDWIYKNIPQANQKRLVDLMQEMRKNENLWIYISY